MTAKPETTVKALVVVLPALAAFACAGNATSFQLAEFSNGHHGYRITCPDGAAACTAQAESLCGRYTVVSVPGDGRMEVECGDGLAEKPATPPPSAAEPEDPSQRVQKAAARALKATVVIQSRAGVGTGFVVAGGLVVTALHVVAGAESILVRTPDGAAHPVKAVVGFDRTNDVALLDAGIDGPTLTLSSAQVVPGAPVVVAGTPRGLAGTVTAGVVSAVRSEPLELIQLDAAISAGSSGGPVLSRNGRVIGMVRMFVRDGQNLNFAVPGKVILRLVESRTAGLSLYTFAELTAPAPAAVPKTEASTKIEFPASVAGFAFGSQLAQASTACAGRLVGNPGFALCPFQPVRVPFGDGRVGMEFTANELTMVSVHGARFEEVHGALTDKYGLPNRVEAARKDQATWKAGSVGRAIWYLDGGTVIATSQDGKEVLVFYVSDRRASLVNKNY